MASVLLKVYTALNTPIPQLEDLENVQDDRNSWPEIPFNSALRSKEWEDFDQKILDNFDSMHIMNEISKDDVYVYGKSVVAESASGSGSGETDVGPVESGSGEETVTMRFLCKNITKMA